METNWCGWYSISSYAGQLAEHLPQRMHFLGFTPEMRVTVSIMILVVHASSSPQPSASASSSVK